LLLLVVVVLEFESADTNHSVIPIINVDIDLKKTFFQHSSTNNNKRSSEPADGEVGYTYLNKYIRN
jgi:hypothetical protein